MRQADAMNDTASDKDSPVLLLVDDDELYCRVLREALEKRGYKIHTACDPATALQLARTHAPDYAVVDLRIGNESGLELVRRLTERDPDTRIIMLTGYASVATAVEAIKLGAVHYLSKPARADEVIAALQRTEGDAGVSPAENPPSVKRLEWEHLQRVLVDHGGNVSAAARALKMHRRTLQRKIAKRPVKE
jgi:two-component system response regulator RegA